MNPPGKSNLHTKLLPVMLSYGIAGACLYWVFHDLDFAGLARSFAGVNWWWVPPAILFDLLVYVVAGWEWQILLQPAGRLSLVQTTQAIFAGRYANDVFPVHVGYLIRIYLASRWAPANVASVAPSLLVERFFDGFWLALGMGLAAVYFPLPHKIAVMAQIWIGIILFGLATGVIILFRKPKPQEIPPNDSPSEASHRAVAQQMQMNHESGDSFSPSPPRSGGEGRGKVGFRAHGEENSFNSQVQGKKAAGHKIVQSKWVATFRNGINSVFEQLHAIGRSWLLPAGLALSLLKLAVQFLAFASLFQAHHFRFPITVQLAVFLVAYAGLSLPSTPASVGVFQLLCIAALQMFNVPKEEAASFALLAFGVLTLPLSLAGFFALAQSGLTLHKIRTEAAEWKSR